MSKKKTILVIDDDSEVLDVISSFLKQASFDIISCNNPLKLEEILKKDLINAVVCDYYMPGRTGNECLKVIRKEKGTNFPVIMITGRKDHLNDGEDKNIVEDQFNAVYEKPLNFKKLISTLNRELTEFKIIDPKDFVSIKLDGICSPIGNDKQKESFNVVEFIDDQSLWIEISNGTVSNQKYYSFHIRCTNNNSIIDCQFQGKVEEITESDDNKSIVLVASKTLDPDIMNKLKGVYIERQNDIADFLKMAKGY